MTRSLRRKSFFFALLSTDADIVYFHGYGEDRSELAILLSRLRGRKIIFAPYFHVYPYRSLVRAPHDRVSAWGRKGAVHNTIWPGRNGGAVVYSVCGRAWYYLSYSIDPERTASIDQEVSSCP